MRRMAGLLCLLSLAGCLVGPDYERPPPANPPTAEFKEGGIDFRPAMPRDAIDRGPWWQVYGDPTLWRRTYDANRSTIGDNPDNVRIGTTLRIPPKP